MSSFQQEQEQEQVTVSLRLANNKRQQELSKSNALLNKSGENSTQLNRRKIRLSAHNKWAQVKFLKNKQFTSYFCFNLFSVRRFNHSISFLFSWFEFVMRVSKNSSNSYSFIFSRCKAHSFESCLYVCVCVMFFCSRLKQHISST